MGKNQAYKAMQKARLGSSSSAGPVEIEDGMVDGSFHSPEWHAARLASLNTSHTITWEEYKKKQKEDELKKGELEADTDRMMKEYRAQLDAERARKLAQGRNCSSSKSGHEKERKNRDLKKRSKKRRKVLTFSNSYCPILLYFFLILFAKFELKNVAEPRRHATQVTMVISIASNIRGGNHPSLAPHVHPRIHPAATKKKENLEDPDPDPDQRDRRGKRSTSLEPSTLQATMKRPMAPCHFQDSLRK
ncbi:uncharacterized protein LOC111458159 isoform X1 [Cucurbita moschata]|uniref:Uncharacterized protein LOC111458159 isoform X1 n=1 Tax=Cucurbita moschata TaxID=3662 RepID=A0A6J1GW96_CUCMO|nr:uncharacterized protein LOC111458159 isoform X1 [Cucurbita moschata]